MATQTPALAPSTAGQPRPHLFLVLGLLKLVTHPLEEPDIPASWNAGSIRRLRELLRPNSILVAIVTEPAATLQVLKGPDAWYIEPDVTPVTSMTVHLSRRSSRQLWTPEASCTGLVPTPGCQAHLLSLNYTKRFLRGHGADPKAPDYVAAIAYWIRRYTGIKAKDLDPSQCGNFLAFYEQFGGAILARGDFSGITELRDVSPIGSHIAKPEAIQRIQAATAPHEEAPQTGLNLSP